MIPVRLQKSSLFEISLLVVVVALGYFVFFHKLGDYTVRMWDEARNGANALEMLENQNFLATYFGGFPDLWNTKPPLLIWLIALFFKTFGVGELSLRLPSAIASLLVAVSLFLFSSRFLKNAWLGFLSALILFSSVGFSDVHVARSGDFDALLVLFVFLGSLFFFFHTESSRPKFLNISSVFFSLAVLTKGVAGLFLIPGLLLYLLLSKKFKETIFTKTFWQSSLIFIILTGGYYFLREKFNPGYLIAVWNNELLGRYGSVTGAQGTDNTFWYYWNYLRNFRFRRWAYLLPLAPLGYFLTGDKTVRKWIIFSLTLSVSYFLIISVSGTKNLWYDAQLYPFIASLAGLFIFTVIGKFPKIIKPIAFLAVFLVGAKLYLSNLEYLYQPDILRSDPCIKYGYLLRDHAFSPDDSVWVHQGSEFCMPFYFYVKKVGAQTTRVEEIKRGDRILTCDRDTYDAIAKKFSLSGEVGLAEGCTKFAVN